MVDDVTPDSPSVTATPRRDATRPLSHDTAWARALGRSSTGHRIRMAALRAAPMRIAMARK